MVTQLVVSLLLGIAIIFVPYYIGRFIPIILREEEYEPSPIVRWLVGCVGLIVLGIVIGLLILIGNMLWIAAGHLLGNF